VLAEGTATVMLFLGYRLQSRGCAASARGQIPRATRGVDTREPDIKMARHHRLASLIQVVAGAARRDDDGRARRLTFLDGGAEHAGRNPSSGFTVAAPRHPAIETLVGDFTWHHVDSGPGIFSINVESASASRRTVRAPATTSRSPCSPREKQRSSIFDLSTPTPRPRPST
jgi:lipoate synthase